MRGAAVLETKGSGCRRHGFFRKGDERRMGKRRLVSAVLVCMLVLVQIFGVGGGCAKAADNTSFQLYFYSESADPLYVDIWNWAGIEFGAGPDVVLNTDWGWNHPQAVMQPVAGKDNWYSTEIAVKDSAAADGFDIYQGGNTNDNKVATYDNQWNNPADYGTLVSGAYPAYAVKDGVLYTDLSELGLTDDGSSETGYRLTVTADATSVEVGGTVTLTASVTENGQAVPDLAAAGLHLYWWDNTNNSVDWLGGYDSADDSCLAVTVCPQAAGTYEIQARLQDSTWQDLSIQKISLTVTDAGGPEEPDTSVTGDLDIAKVPNLSENFIMGMDISSVISLFDSGVTFRDWTGNTIDNVTDFCRFLASNGITHIRVRVWNDPYDAAGNGYGGGNNDVAKAAQIAAACEAAGIKVMVDFHCSDLWTDPGKQMVPKAWRGFTPEQKAAALTAFIADSLAAIDPNGSTVDMVQVGNETTTGFIGEQDAAAMCTLFNAGAAGVRAFNPNTKVVIHVTNPEKGSVTTWAANLDRNQVDYDIIATSYYPYWHGTLANLKSEFEKVRADYGKDVMVAETSYAYTLTDSDGHANTVREGNNDTGGNTTEPFTEQGQATSIRNLIHAVNEAGGLGVFYWEPAWLTVGDTRNLTGAELEAQIAANRQKWETFGSGWASSYAGEYDAEDAGKWYGGSAVDNEAMFYPDGRPTPGLHVWEYVKTGAVSNAVSIDRIVSPETTVYEGEAFSLPETVTVTYNKGSAEEPVTWAAAAAEKIDTGAACTYIVSGTVHFSREVTSGQYAGKTFAPVTCTLKVKPVNRIADAADAGFEQGTSFTVGGTGISAIPSEEDPYAGAGSMHWWNETACEGTVTYNPAIVLAPGEYVLEAVAQGFAGDLVSVQILDEADQVLFAGPGTALEGWHVWKTPSVSFALTEETAVKVRVTVNMQAKGWGTADELYLHSAVEERIVYIDDAPADEDDKPSTGDGDDKPSAGEDDRPSTGGGDRPSGGGGSGSLPSAGGSAADSVTVTVNPDGTVTVSTTFLKENSAGNQIRVTTEVTRGDDGAVTEIKEVTVIEKPAADTTATVTVLKTAAGTVTEAAADVTRTGKAQKKGTKMTLPAAVTAQIREAAKTEDILITVTVTDGAGAQKYTVSVNAADLADGAGLQAVALDEKTGDYILVNDVTYGADKNGDLSVTLPDGRAYVLLNENDMDAAVAAVLKTVKAKKKSKTVAAGKKTEFVFADSLNMDNVKKITYSTSDKKTAAVTKKGKITAKKKGAAVVKAKVTLNNGSKKTVVMKIKVK